MNSTILSKNKSYSYILRKFLDPVAGNNSRWLLCYRASTNGWEASTFHINCNGKKNTVTTIESGNHVFGGFTDIPWGMMVAWLLLLLLSLSLPLLLFLLSLLLLTLLLSLLLSFVIILVVVVVVVVVVAVVAVVKVINRYSFPIPN